MIIDATMEQGISTVWQNFTKFENDRECYHTWKLSVILSQDWKCKTHMMEDSKVSPDNFFLKGMKLY